METAALVQHILDTHHAYLREHMPRLGAAFEEMGAGKQLMAPWGHLVRTLNTHMMKEEQILFPAILELAAGRGASGCGVAGPIAQMEAEHDEIRTIEMALRAAAHKAGPHERGLLELLDDLAEHARLEDESLFPAALALDAAPEAPDSICWL